MWGRLFYVLLLWISVLWMFDRCKVFHSFYNWFYTRHQLTGLDRNLSFGFFRIEPTVLTGLWATFTSNCPKVLAIFSEIPWKYGKVTKPLWLCGWFNALGGLVLWQLFKNWSCNHWFWVRQPRVVLRTFCLRQSTEYSLLCQEGFWPLSVCVAKKTIQ